MVIAKPSLWRIWMKRPTLSSRQSRETLKAELPSQGSKSASIALPYVGDILNYVYLWRHEQKAGRTNGLKERPVLVIAVDAIARSVIVCPITTKPAHEGRAHIRVPQNVARQAMQLPRPDESWVVVDEYNRFTWIGYDLRPIANSGSFKFGRATDGFTLSVLNAVMAGKLPMMDRD
jgi:PemK-like, MazF-like toxin of type II toxin-antitoxin system